MKSRIADIIVTKQYKISNGVQREKISFKVLDTLPIIPNYIRVAIVGGLMGVKIMTCDISDVESDDRKILRKDIVDYRIRQIPLIQSTKESTTFELEYKNDTDHYCAVFSDKLVPTMFMDNLPIVTLSPRSYIKIKNIKVVESTSFKSDDPAFSNCSSYEYRTMDYVPVLYLSPNGAIYTKHAYYKDLGYTEDELLFKKILIKDPNYDEELKSYNPKCYDFILSEVPKFYTGQEATIKDVYLSFETFGTIDAREMVRESMLAIKKNLDAIGVALESGDKLKVDVRRGDGFIITIKQDMKVTAELFQQLICDSYPATITYDSPIHSASEVTMKIYHTEGEDIFKKVLADASQIFASLAASF